MTYPRIEAAARALCHMAGYSPDGDYITPRNNPNIDVNWKVYEDEAGVALAAADAAAWRPIESAPMDDSWIMVFEDGDFFIARNIGDDFWMQSGSICNPTHWQSLPAAPVNEVRR